MKAEDSPLDSKLNIMNFEDSKAQVNSAEITKVLTGSGVWINCIKGSFHFYVTKGQKPMPFVQFDTHDVSADPSRGEMRVEMFPTNVAGVAYYVE